MANINIPTYLSHLVLMPQFPVLKSENDRVYTAGEILDVTFGGREVEMGTAEVAAVKRVQVGKIGATFCQYLTGKGPQYLLGILRKQYHAEPHNYVQLVVLKWTQRHLPAHENHLKDWWLQTIESTPGYEGYKMTRVHA